MVGGTHIPTKGIGKLILNDQELDCVYIPDAQEKILSVRKLTRAGNFIGFFDNLMLIIPQIKMKTIAQWFTDALKNKKAHIIESENGLYHLNINKQTGKIKPQQNFTNPFLHQLLGITTGYNNPINKQVNKVDARSIDLTMQETPTDETLKLHCSLGHMHFRNIMRLGYDLTIEQQNIIKDCLTCKAMKYKNKPTTGKKERPTQQIFEHLHLDTAGPIENTAGKWYVVLIVDDYSRYITPLVFQNKRQISSGLTGYLRHQYSLFHRIPNKITTDKGTEFHNLQFIVDGGPLNQAHMDRFLEPEIDLAPTGNKQYNGKAERSVQTIKNIWSCLTAHLTKEADIFTPYAFQLATTIYNRSPHSGISYNLPYGKYFERTTKLHKDDNLAKRNNYLHTQPAFHHKNIKNTLPNLPMFLEDVLYSISTTHGNMVLPAYYVGITEENKLLVKIPGDPIDKPPDITTKVVQLGSFELHRGGKLRKANEHSPYKTNYAMYVTDKNDQIVKAFTEIEYQNLTKPKHQKKKLRTANAIMTDSLIPKSYQHAMKIKGPWINAIQSEIDAFLNQNVYEPFQQKPPSNCTFLNTFWIFTIKYPSLKQKARLITVNPSTVGHRDKNSTSPVAKQTSLIALFLKFAHTQFLKFTTYDISTAFLHSPVEEDKYLLTRIPPGFRKYFPNTEYLRIKKYAYGLNCAPVEFHKTLTKVLQQTYQSSITDFCFYKTPQQQLYSLHHVDDLITLSTDPTTFEHLLSNHFQLKINPQPDSYLGLDLKQHHNTIHLTLENYILQAINELPSSLRNFIIRGHSIPSPLLFKNLLFPQANSTILKSTLQNLENEDVYKNLTTQTSTQSYELAPLKFDDILLPDVYSPEQIDIIRRGEVHKHIQSERDKQKEKSKSKKRTKKQKKSIDIPAEYIPDDEYGLKLQQKIGYPYAEFSLHHYQKIIGIITYIANKGRFDTQVYASMLAQFSAMPTHKCFSQALQVLQYVYRTRSTYYTYERTTENIETADNITIKLYTDASYTNINSQGGYFMTINGMYAGSKSYRLNYIFTSSFDAELLALREGIVNAKNFIATLKDFDFKNIQLEVYCDNLSVISTVTKRTTDRRPNDRVYSNCVYYLRQSYFSGAYTLNHIKGDINPADLLTKALGGDRFTQLMTSELIKPSFKWEFINQRPFI